MGNEATSHRTAEQTNTLYSYVTIDTTLPLVKEIQRLAAISLSPLALVAITFNFENEGRKNADRFIETERIPTAVLEGLRPLVRCTDRVFLLGHKLYFLLLGANMEDGQIVQTRLWDALLQCIHQKLDGELGRLYSVTSGHSAYPQPFAAIDEFIEASGEVQLRSDFVSEKSPCKSHHYTGNEGSQDNEDDWLTVARRLGIPYLVFLPRKSPERVKRLIKPRLAQELQCYPLGRERNMLTVAMLNPQDQSALNRLQQETGYSIFPVLANPQELRTALAQLLEVPR